MIYFVQGVLKGYTHKVLESADEAPDCHVWNYQKLLQQDIFPCGTYIFLDRERMDQWELRIYSQLYNHLKNAGAGYKVLNNPARVMNRYELLRMLYHKGINDFNAYLVSERQKPGSYPVFIRRIFDHSTPLTGLLHDETELESALDNLRSLQEPDEGLVIIEYCAEPVAKNLFRKLASYRIGENLFFIHTVHEESWLVKHGTKNLASDDLYKNEYEMIKNNAYENELRPVFDLANIDYGRVDFGLVNGKIQVYEINTNPKIGPPEDHPNPVRTRSLALAWNRYLDALRAIDTTDPTAPKTGKFNHPDLLPGEWHGCFIKRN